MTSSVDLGRYRLLEPIGQGGMSTVYAGEHATLRRPVAIKILHAHLVADKVQGRRMFDEAHTMAALHHPGIVEVLDVGTTADGRTFVVMERLVGEPLSERLRRGRLSEERAVVFARQLASALEAAHAAGVVHRDLKPENVFVVHDPDVPGGERVKLLDFGIAKRAITGRERTLTGIVLGTPAYMAPEQSAGSQELDGRTDVYALGIVMYLMVTGALPFVGANTDELFAEHAFCAPPTPSAVAGVSPRLSAIIERCLAKRPTDRYDSMAVLAATLDGLDTAGGRPQSVFEDEDTNVEDDSLDGAAGALDDRDDRDDEGGGEATTRRPAPPEAGRRGRRPAWVWPVAVAGAVALGLGFAVVTRGRGPAPAVAPSAPAAAAVGPAAAPAAPAAPAAALAVAAPARPAATTSRARVSSPAAEPARPRAERRAERPAPAPPPRVRPSTRRAPTRAASPVPAAPKEEAFVEPPTLF